MTIKIPPDVGSQLKKEAQRQGLDADTYATTLIKRGLPKAVPDQGTPDLLARWAAEDATDDPDEIQRRNEEAEQFMRGLARNRQEMEGPHARKIWP